MSRCKINTAINQGVGTERELSSTNYRIASIGSRWTVRIALRYEIEDSYERSIRYAPNQADRSWCVRVRVEPIQQRRRSSTSRPATNDQRSAPSRPHHRCNRYRRRIRRHRNRLLRRRVRRQCSQVVCDGLHGIRYHVGCSRRNITGSLIRKERSVIAERVNLPHGRGDDVVYVLRHLLTQSGQGMYFVFPCGTFRPRVGGRVI